MSWDPNDEFGTGSMKSVTRLCNRYQPYDTATTVLVCTTRTAFFILV